MFSWYIIAGAYRDLTCVDCEAYTVDENSRFMVLISLILCVLMSRNILFTFRVFCPLAIVIQEIHRKDLNKRKQGTRMNKLVLLRGDPRKGI